MGEKMPLLTRPQTYRVVRELLPRVRFTPAELLRWLEEIRLAPPAGSKESAENRR
jgi:hypothetical protein